MASNGAPVCSDSKDEVITQPTPNNSLPIPVANDMASLWAAINALRAAVMRLTNRTGGPPPKQFTPQFNGFTTKKTTSRWSEVRPQRTTKVVRIKQKTNPNNYVDVEQIDGLVMQDQVTGDKWTWSR